MPNRLTTPKHLWTEAMRTGLCQVEDCKGDVKARGYCQKHYQQVRTHGQVLPSSRKKLCCRMKDRPAHCLAPGCETVKLQARWLCVRHYQQVRRHGKFVS